jgi:hypothetical protein
MSSGENTSIDTARSLFDVALGHIFLFTQGLQSSAMTIGDTSNHSSLCFRHRSHCVWSLGP